MRRPVHAIEGLRLWRAEKEQRAQTAHTRAPGGDTVSLSAEAVTALADGRNSETASARAPDAEALRGAGIYSARAHGGRALALGQPSSPEPQPADELTEPERQQLEELKARDAEVRRHEQAHAARGGSHAGSPKYEYTTGPDGQRYVAEGSVSIDVAKVHGDPEATLRKMETVIAAATAPAQPSAQDRKVAATARASVQEARAELAAATRDPDQAHPGEAPVETDAPSPERSNPHATGSIQLSPRLGASLRAYQAHARHAA